MKKDWKTDMIHPEKFIPAFLIFLISFAAASAQTEDSGMMEDMDGMEELLSDESMVAQNTPAPAAASPQDPAQTAAEMAGFAESPWMSEFSKVRETLKNLATSETAAEKVEIIALGKMSTFLLNEME